MTDSTTSPAQPPDPDFPNVILVVIDALRAGNMGCYGAPDGASPGLDRIAAESTLFEDTYCTWNTTDPSLTTILTGKYPRSHGITNHGDTVEPEDLEVFERTGTTLLSEMLRSRGYNTMAVDWMGRWFKLGFDHYGYPAARDLFKKAYLYLKYMVSHLDIFQCYTDEDGSSDGSLLEDIRGVLSTFLFTRNLAEIQDARRVTDEGLRLIDRNGESPFFLFLHYWDVHTPYHCPRRYRNYRGDDPHRKLRDRYAGAVRYVDEQLMRLRKGLAKRKELDNTVLIITSDHGESLTEHDIYFDHHGLYEVNTHVPLLIRYPRAFPPGRRVRGFVQHVDLCPTLLNLFGAETPAALPQMDGEDLMGLVQGEDDEIRSCVYSEESYVQNKRAIRTPRYRYIEAPDGEGYCRYCHCVHVGPCELYDLQEDPEETNNLVKKRPSVRRRLEARLHKIVRRLRKNREETVENKDVGQRKELLSDEEQEELQDRFRSLGYH